MNKVINLGNIKYALTVLEKIKNTNYSPVDIRITNSQITKLNKVIGYTVFRKDALYVNTTTLHDIMQPLGGRGRHNYHNLEPNEIFSALVELKNSKNITSSFDGRFLIITLAATSKGIPIAIVVEPNAELSWDRNIRITKIITIYPHKK